MNKILCIRFFVISGRCFSRGMNATQSHTYTHYSGPLSADLAVDGNTFNRLGRKFSSCSIAVGSTTWWQVDLGRSVVVTNIVIAVRGIVGRCYVQSIPLNVLIASLLPVVIASQQSCDCPMVILRLVQ